MSSYISWGSLSDGEKENLRKDVCQRILEQPGVADRFVLARDTLYRMVVYRLKSKHEDSSVTVSVHEGSTRWPEKAGVYIKRNDGYGNGQTQTLRFHLKEDQSFNIKKAATRACELDQVSIDHAVRRREDKAQRAHKDDLKKLISAEIKGALEGTAWEVDDYWDSAKIRLKDSYSTCITVSVPTYAAPKVKVEFPTEFDAKANATLLKQINTVLLEIMGVIEGETFRSAFGEKPQSLLT